MAFQVSVASWNTQGNPLEDPLSVGFLQQLLTDHDIVVLQSCCDLVGTAVAIVSAITVGRIRCQVKGLRQAISLDPFSSVAILSRIGSAFPLSGGATLEEGVVGRFGVACSVDHPAQPFEMIAIQARGGLAAQSAGEMLRRCGDRLDPRVPHILAVELEGTAPIASAGSPIGSDNRRIAHPSPGTRYDSFIAWGATRIEDGGVTDAGGASDNDAVHAIVTIPEASERKAN